MKKYGLLLGSFNPIHNGHLNIANHVMNYLLLDKIFFMPVGQPWGKNELASKEHRYNMTKIATNHNSHFLVSKIDLDSPGISMACQTLTKLHQQHNNSKWYLIMGNDNFNTFHQWKNKDLILKLSTPVIVRRNIDMPLGKSYFTQNDVINFHQSVIFINNNPLINVSSTLIREIYRNISKDKLQDVIKTLIPLKVNEYILKNNIY